MGDDAKALRSLVSSVHRHLGDPYFSGVSLHVFDFGNDIMPGETIQVRRSLNDFDKIFPQLIASCNPAQRGNGNLLESYSAMPLHVVIILRTDAIDMGNLSEVTRKGLIAIINQGKESGISMVLHSAGDSVFGSTQLGEITRYAFTLKMALIGAPGDFISSAYFIDPEVKIPSKTYEALVEGSESVSCLGVNKIWLFNKE
jgi:hypothetical protein